MMYHLRPLVPCKEEKDGSSTLPTRAPKGNSRHFFSLTFWGRGDMMGNPMRSSENMINKEMNINEKKMIRLFSRTVSFLVGDFGGLILEF